MLKRLSRSIRYRLGMHVVAPALEGGTDEGVLNYYNSRPSRCSFLQDSEHYERPRIEWILDTVMGGRLLEIGCADGGVSELLSGRVDSLFALDVCEASITELLARGLQNVEARVGLAESFEPPGRFDWIVMSELLEHIREPEQLVARALRWLAPGGRLLASSPEGQWDGDSIEHLHVFGLESWARLFARAGAHSLRAFKIPDRKGRDRWLGADVTASA
jgi:2-polyprenyl-3-methyl-5-hydroxy-6-metoxy-1,4-benzoquinol methylase